jgi:NAD(P)-dependent dehydrogenase (short-subunit alcohol dehydrogenase family)
MNSSILGGQNKSREEIEEMSHVAFDFATRVVMVTGANGNLGSAVARAFGRAGAQLILVGRKPERVREALPELCSHSNTFVAPATDLTDPDAVQAMVREALKRFRRIDVLANTVGGYRAGDPVHETQVKTWDFMMALNARSAFLISQAVIPSMLEQSYGKIIHTASRAGLAGGRDASAYAAAKSAVLRLTESLAQELKHRGINANCILPGTIDTPENRASMPDADFARWVTPEQIADVFLFLASDAAQALQGALIPVYGRS